MLVLMVVLALLFAMVLLLTNLINDHKYLNNILFIAGILSPALIFILHSTPVEINMILGGWEPISGIAIGLDNYSRYFLVAEFIVFGTVGFYSIFYYRDEPRKNKFFVLILIMHAGMMGVFLSKDIFNLFVLMELVSVSAFALVAFSREKSSEKAAFRYLIFSIIASYLFLFSIGIIYVNTGSLNFEIIRENITLSREIDIAIALAFTAMILKTGIFPLHFWLPDVYSESDTPICALLAGMTRRAPIYAMLLFTIYLPMNHLSQLLLIVAFASTFFGFIMAMFQNDVWRLLAYASVGLMGIVLVGIATENHMGVTYYVFAHAIVTVGLFLTTGTISDQQKTRNIRDLTYRHHMLIFISVIMLSFALGSMSPSLNAYAKNELLIGLSRTETFLFQSAFVLALLIMFKMNFLLWQDGDEKTPEPRITPRSFLSAIPAALSIALGIYLYPTLVLTDILLLGAAGALFFFFLSTNMLEYTGVERLGERFRDLPATNNFYFMVYFGFLVVLLFYTL